MGGAGAKTGCEQGDGDNPRYDTGVVGLIDALGVIGLLGWIAAVRTLIGDRDDDLGRVGVPVVVQLGRRVAGHIVTDIAPGQAGPSRAGPPELAVVPTVLGQVDRDVVVYYLGEFPDAARIVTRGLAERCASWALAARPTGLVSSGTIAAGGRARPIAAEGI